MAESHLPALHALLRVAVRHPNLLHPAAFEELADTIATFAPFRSMGVILPETGDKTRIYALARRPALDFVSVGVRLPMDAAFRAKVFAAGEAYRCDDTRDGDDMERAIAAVGVLSYLVIPLRSGAGAVTAAVVFGLDEVGAASATTADVFVEIAEVIGSSLDNAVQLSRERRLAMILETSGDALLAWDREGLVTDVNEAALRLTGRTSDELLGMPIRELLPALDRTRERSEGSVAHVVESASGARMELSARGPGGAPVRRTVAASITAAPDDPVVAAHALLRDLSQVIAAEQAEQAAKARLYQIDRLSTLGTLAAGVAHEINNPAAFLLLGVSMLERLLRGPRVQMEDTAAASAAEMLRELRESIQRIADIARDLRLFSSAPPPDAERRLPTLVTRSIESALSLTRGKLIERAKIDLRLAEVPPVLIDEGRLGQVVVNLLVHAAQAIPTPSSKGGTRAHTVTIETRSDGSTVEIEVRDTGAGIRPEDLPGIWTPFSTTTSPEVGTGLGLAISREIIEGAGGSIRAESPALPQGIGTRFIISLPVAGRKEALTPVTSPTPRLVSERARVLVVEDESPLARALAEQLGRVHQIAVAGSADAALRLLDAGEPFDVVLCDLRMPGMSGETFYRRIRETSPALAQRFIFMTGVGFGADVERFLADAGRLLLEKPFSTEDALEAIAEVVTTAGAKGGARDR